MRRGLGARGMSTFLALSVILNDGEVDRSVA